MARDIESGVFLILNPTPDPKPDPGTLGVFLNSKVEILNPLWTIKKRKRGKIEKEREK